MNSIEFLKKHRQDNNNNNSWGEWIKRWFMPLPLADIFVVPVPAEDITDEKIRMPGFLDTIVVDLVSTYVRHIIETNRDDRLMPCTNFRPQSFNVYDPMFETILFMKTREVTRFLGLEEGSLIPLAALGRVYFKGAQLPLHRDLGVQEHSVSVHIEQVCASGSGSSSSSSTNELYIIDPEKGKRYIPMGPGDAVIIPGGRIEHGRDPFEGELMIQLIFHYVSANRQDLAKHRREFTYAHMLGL